MSTQAAIEQGGVQARGQADGQRQSGVRQFKSVDKDDIEHLRHEQGE